MRSLLQQIRDCLQTETKSQLCSEPPEKFVLVGTQSYSLLLLRKGGDEHRTKDVVESIRSEVGNPNSDYPFVIAQGLSLDDAYAFQLAMSCCDCVTAVVADEVVIAAPVLTFAQMLNEVTGSKEFELIEVRVERIPQNDEGNQLNWLFFGVAQGLPTPKLYHMFRKKARLLGLWANRIGADVTLINE